MPKRVLTPSEITALEQLNQRLAAIEKWILDLARRFEAEILALEPHDWELDLTYEFTTESESKVHWLMSLRYTLKKWRNPSLDHYWGLADGNDHNVSQFLVCGLEEQKHCFLMHQLYDDFLLSWDDILSLEWMWLDFELWAQFDFYLGQKQIASELEKRLVKIERFLIKKIELFQRRARQRVLSGEEGLYDYELTLRPSFYERKWDDSSFCVFWEDNIKHRNPMRDFRAFAGKRASRLLQELELTLLDMGLEYEKEELLTKFKHLSVDLILRYQYRLPLKGTR